MLSYIDKIKEISIRLLKECQVEMVIGFRKGTVPMMNEPHFAKSPEAVEDFVWDSNCGINLCNYLTNRGEKIGIVAKGCDSRNIVTHIIENKIKRDQLVIIGVPCKGMIDKRKISAMFEGEIGEVSENENNITIKGDGFEKTLNKQIEALSPQEKAAYFEKLLEPCIRCYACRNACPLCYCPTCFTDESRPQWVGKGQDPTDVTTFHFLRAYHCAGRCTDCGACQRSCPVGINMRVLTKKLEKDCLELFGWEAGLDPDVRPPLDTYKPSDPDEFIK
jgi:formate dehydrogenase subunit beta